MIECEDHVTAEAAERKTAAFAADDGTICIPAVSFGPVRAIISVPPGMKFRSEYGRFRKLPDGRWQFNADGMDSDILFPVR